MPRKKTIECPHCGNKTYKDFPFCGNCGSPLPGEETKPVKKGPKPTPPAVSPESAVEAVEATEAKAPASGPAKEDTETTPAPAPELFPGPEQAEVSAPETPAEKPPEAPAEEPAEAPPAESAEAPAETPGYTVTVLNGQIGRAHV